MGRLVFHIARRQDWEAAQIDCEYRVSTLGRSLDDVGFIHCSASRDQVLAVASAFYESVSEPLVLLTIEVDHVGSEVRDEFTGDSPEPFPHVYGPIPVSSVTVVGDLHRDADGAFSWPIAWPDGARATRARTGSMRDMADTSDVESVERVIAAPPEAIFELLADPRRHQEIDGSGTVRDAKGEPQRLALGSEFGMSMKMGVPYAMVSTVVEFDDNRRIAWQTRGPTRLGSWAGGRIWRYEIEPVDGGSLVRESWDISKESAITKPFVRMGATKTRENMAKTLARIEEITTG
ncbi:MAG: DUF952 domain-containing protein [Acidimicrobiia bacterium]